MAILSGLINRTKTSKTNDGSNVPQRVSGYGDMYSIPLTGGTYALSDEGSYFKATNPTPGTAITHAITTAFSTTAALFCLRNTDAEGAKRIYLDYVDLGVVGTPTTATSAQLAVTLDTINRFSSGGSAITPLNSNSDSATATIAALNFGAVVLAAASGSARLLTRQTLKTQATPCLAVGDSLLLNFGAVETVTGPLSGTVAQTLSVSTGPLIIGGGDSLNFHVWYPACTVAPTFEFEMGWWER